MILECWGSFLSGVKRFVAHEVQNKNPPHMRPCVQYFKVHNRIFVQKLQVMFLLHIKKGHNREFWLKRCEKQDMLTVTYQQQFKVVWVFWVLYHVRWNHIYSGLEIISSVHFNTQSWIFGKRFVIDIGMAMATSTRVTVIWNQNTRKWTGTTKH
jgi:hypothetical protein